MGPAFASSRFNFFWLDFLFLLKTASAMCRSFVQRVLRTRWHLDAKILTASLKIVPGDSCPIVSIVKMKWSLRLRTAIFSSHPGSPVSSRTRSMHKSQPAN